MFVFSKKYFICFVALTLLVGLIVKSYQEGEKSENETLVIGLQSGYPPFEFLDSSGKIVGFDVDLAGLIAQKLEKTLIINNMDFESEILSLKQGKIDLILSGMNITPSRLKEISMIPYHGEASTNLSLIFWKKIPEGIHSLEDIAKLTDVSISVESGAIPEMYISNFPEIPTKSFQGALAPLMDVKFGKSLANLVETDVAEYLQKKHSEIKLLNIPLPAEETILGFGIGIKKENQELFQSVQHIIQELKKSGELQKLEDKWFKGEE